MKKRKVLHIVEAFGGGVFSILVDLTNKMIDEFDITIAYSIRKESPKDFENYFDKRIKFIKIRNFTRSINPKKDIKALKEIKNVIQQEKPDIVHLHSSKAGVLGRLAISGKKVKMFYNPHGFSFLKQDDSKVKRLMYWLIEKVVAMLNRKCTIVGCSNGEYLEAKKLNKNSICINNGIDVEKLKEETKDLKERQTDYNNLKICTVGRIDYSKNPKLFNQIAENFPQYKFTWIGEGELRKELTSSNINITGWKTRKEVLELLNEQDIFILASLWEGLPISLLQAMYMKKICIVSNCIGNRDVIVNERNGFIAKNLNDYIEILKNLISNGLDYEIRELAKQDSINKFNLKKMIKEYIEVYKMDTEKGEIFRERRNMEKESKQLLLSEECKEIQLKILTQVANICDENNLIYCMCGGTLLGAVRHQGFIPWDDDIDIYLPRNDYEKLINILKKQTQYEWLSVIDDSEKGFYCPYAKAIDNRTMTKSKDNIMQFGVWIDIFPIDGLPENKLKRTILVYKCYFLRAVILAMTTDFSSTEIKKRGLKRILARLAKIIGKDRIYRYYKGVIKKSTINVNLSKYAGSLFARYGKREINTTELLLTRDKYQFEDKKFYGPKNYDTYLTSLYGNYMTLPPENKRESHEFIAWRI